MWIIQLFKPCWVGLNIIGSQACISLTWRSITWNEPPTPQGQALRCCVFLTGNYWTNQAAWSRYKTGILVNWQNQTSCNHEVSSLHPAHRSCLWVWYRTCRAEFLSCLMHLCISTEQQQTNDYFWLSCICFQLPQRMTRSSVGLSANATPSPIRCLWMLGTTSVEAPWSVIAGLCLLLTATSRKHTLDIFRPHVIHLMREKHANI